MAPQKETLDAQQTLTVNDDEAHPLVHSATESNVIIEFKPIEKFLNEKGMNWLVTALFIVGETAGGGLIALPSAMVSAGVFWGVIIIIMGAIICTFTGAQLAENWTILQKRWPQYRSHCRKPYPAMGEKAIGKNFSYFVSLLLDVTQFGTAVVFLLLAAKNIETFLSMAHMEISFCRLIVVVALLMLPVTMLKSPKDFWWAVILAMCTTAMAVTLIVYGAAKDRIVCSVQANYPPMNMSKIAMCFGTVMFAFGGHAAFPTIQHDMKKPHQFRRAVTLAFLIICVMYMPVSIAGYLSYGDSLLDTIIPSLQIMEIRFAVNLLITLHVILALTIVFNPLNQEVEDYLQTPHHFCWQRVVVRGGVMIAVVLVGISVPSFGVLLDLVGGSTITTMALLFPVIFNLYLRAGSKKYNDQLAEDNEQPLTFREVLQYTSTRDLVINSVIIGIAIIGGVSATTTALKAMAESEYSRPCWWGVIAHLESTSVSSNHHVASLNCCGAFRNISIYTNDVCMDAATFVSGGSHG